MYALHEFAPDHEDEIAFHIGERIEVVEKDDMYGDGWWKVRLLLVLIVCSSLESVYKYRLDISRGEILLEKLGFSPSRIRLPRRLRHFLL